MIGIDSHVGGVYFFMILPEVGAGAVLGEVKYNLIGVGKVEVDGFKTGRNVIF